jgi:hypothetical protein
LAGISSETTKFYHVVSQLDQRYAAELEDVITSPPERDPYTTLRAELIRRLSPSREQRIRQFLTLEMGDGKPSQFLRHLRSLAPDVPEDFLQIIWSSRLPLNIQAFLAGQHEGSLDAAACSADRISEVAPQPALASVGPSPDSTVLLRGIEDLSHQMAVLSAEQDRLRTSSRDSHLRSRNPRLTSRDPCSSTRDPRPGSRNRRPVSRPPSRVDATATLCWYHRRFGARAQKFTPSCSYRQQRKSTQQTSPAADVCTTTRGRPFITVRSSKRQFLVDTGSDLCVYPRRLIPRRRERTNYDLYAANGTTIHTYGWLPLSRKFGLRRDFTWRFVVADVTHPIIGVGFLSHFGLLVDCRNNRLLDGVTSLSAPAQADNARIPSVKTISDGTPVGSLLAEFPDLTRPAGV